MFRQDLRPISTVFLISILVGAAVTSLPSYIKPCKRNQISLDTCLIDLLMGLKDRLPNGIDELKICPLDPLKLQVVDLGEEYDLMASVQYATFTNITVIGSSNFLIRNLSVDWETPKLTVDIDFPFTKVDCNYNISGSTFFLPISSDGFFQGNFTNVSSHNILYGEFYFKGGKQHMKVVDQSISLDIGTSSALLEDTGNAVKNVLINDFWSTIFTIIKPKAEVKIGEVAVSLIKDMLELYDVESLVPTK